jgi:hypothetical protein
MISLIVNGVHAQVEPTRQRLLADPRIKRYVITDDVAYPDLVSLLAQMGRFYTCLTGKPYVSAEGKRRLGSARRPRASSS